MIKIEAITLEEAYQNAASSLQCSVTELQIEIVQYPTKGFLGLFKKNAIVVATKKTVIVTEEPKVKIEEKPEPKEDIKEEAKPEVEELPEEKTISKKEEIEEDIKPTILNDTIMPESFVSDQDDDNEIGNGLEYTADYDDEFDENNEEEEIEVENEASESMLDIAKDVKVEINELFKSTCFNIEEIEVSVYDEYTLLVEFRGDDAALLIGKEGYRYKALSYMIFNWINGKYELNLRLEIAEFLKNQEESMSRYLESVYEIVDVEGRAQTKILDGVLVQIALKELRNRYPDKYVVIRSTRDGLKYIIINDYHS